MITCKNVNFHWNQRQVKTIIVDIIDNNIIKLSCRIVNSRTASCIGKLCDWPCVNHTTRNVYNPKFQWFTLVTKHISVKAISSRGNDYNLLPIRKKKTHGLERPGPITKTVQVFVKSPQFQSVLMAKNTNFSSGFTPVGHNLHYHPGNCFRFWQNKTVAICFRLFDRIDHYDRFPIVQYPNMYWICLVQCT